MKVILYFLLSISLLSCKSKDDSAAPNEYAAKFVKQLNPTDTFLFDFPVDKNGQYDSRTKHLLDEFDQQLGLPSLEKGFDSIQIRFGYSYEMDGTEKLVILKNDGKKWIAELSEVYVHFDPVKFKIDSSRITRKIAYRSPKSGWVKFINKLFDLKILTIEDNDKIPGFKPSYAMDGWGIGIELATKKAYRFYNYDNPDMYANRYWQAKNVIAIKDLLYHEFSILSKWDKEKEEKRKIRMAEKERQLNEESKSGKKVKIQEVNLKNPADTIVKSEQ